MNNLHQPQGSTTGARPYRSAQEMEALVPIKMQHAAAAFVINHLRAANSPWIGEETQVGGEDDRRGIDFYLTNRAERRTIEVDFSTNDKGGFAVKLKHDWFKEQADGSFVFLQQYAQALFRAFLPALEPGNRIGLIGWKEAQKA